MVYPVPAVMVSCGNNEENYNIITIAWTGTICTNPPMAYISIRPERHSYDIIKETGEFVINLTTEQLTYATDYCGVKSGRDVNKFKEMKLTPKKATQVSAPLIDESPVNIECKLKEIVELGSHHMFIGEVVAVNVDDYYMDEKGKFHLDKAKPITYSHGQYYSLKESIGHFGYSVKKKKTKKKKKK
jgi:flavin reductase (DIM6/NTAB) family NADH-FMN oxidoreductase RutF